MNKQLLFILITILSINCYSQIKFEKGYYIDNSNQKIDCLIENLDWLHNPTEFEYKLTENSDTQKATLKTVKEFGIYNISKYSRYTVKIDKSSDDISRLSNVKKPVFVEEELFLKVLLEGKANLYSFKENNLNRYFYNKDNSDIEQLIYKRYKVSKHKFVKNNTFRNQIWNALKCQNTTLNDIEKLNYRKAELLKIFTNYNKCKNQKFTSFEEKQKKDLFNLSIRPGVNNSSLLIQKSISGLEVDFGNKMSFRLGIEAEFIMPFNKNKWAIIMEPTYQSFQSEKGVIPQRVKVEYKSIELPIGVRYYVFLNEDSKIFINGSFIFESSDNSTIDFDSDKDLEIRTVSNLGFGIGYKYNDTYSLELRYLTNREVLRNYITWRSGYKTISVIVGYSLF